jgi:predicted RNase H-like HicB family nuclease
MRSELIFEVEQEADGGYVAEALGEAIFTQADTLDELRANVQDAVRCHFTGRNDGPRILRLHFVREEVLAAA